MVSWSSLSHRVLPLSPEAHPATLHLQLGVPDGEDVVTDQPMTATRTIAGEDIVLIAGDDMEVNGTLTAFAGDRPAHSASVVERIETLRDLVTDSFLPDLEIVRLDTNEDWGCLDCHLIFSYRSTGSIILPTKVLRHRP